MELIRRKDNTSSVNNVEQLEELNKDMKDYIEILEQKVFDLSNKSVNTSIIEDKKDSEVSKRRLLIG